jgi:hypothetical protein
MTATAYRRPAPAARVHKAAAAKATRSDDTHISSARRTSLRKSAVRTVSTSVKKTSSGGGELARARAILARYVAKYPICNGAKVCVGMVPALHGGTQGCVFLSSATIVINPNHTASLESIIAHEINHLRQYRESR